MSTLCAILIIGIILSIPVFLTILIIRAIKKKPIKKLIISMVICVASIIPLSIIGALTDPAIQCKHDRELISETPSTCTQKGKVLEYCSECDVEVVSYKDKLPHDYQLSETVDATCTQAGYVMDRCSMCSKTQKTKTDALGHSWVINDTVPATCTKQGYIEKVCSNCSLEDIEHTNKIEHSYITDSVVKSTCTSEGYTVEKCKNCSATQKTKPTKVLAHIMKEISRKDPTYDAEGEIVKKCENCEHKESESIAKLEAQVIKFNGLELTIKGYSFTEVDNKYSEHYGKTVIKIPVTIKNVASDPQTLYSVYYKLFCTNGVESANVGYYFDDDVSQGGDLLPGASYNKSFYIVYDGDGVYTIVLDNLLFDEKTIKIQVTK